MTPLTRCLWCPAKRCVNSQVPHKTFRLDGWIAQRIRQWVPNRRAGDWESPGSKRSAMKPRKIQFATAGRTEMLAAGNVGDCHAAVGGVPWSSVTASLHCTRCRIVSQCGLLLSLALLLFCIYRFVYMVVCRVVLGYDCFLQCLLFLLAVYTVPATGTRSPRIAYRHSAINDSLAPKPTP